MSEQPTHIAVEQDAAQAEHVEVQRVQALAHVATEGYGRTPMTFNPDGTVATPKDVLEARTNGAPENTSTR
jgi:hypothetical protein